MTNRIQKIIKVQNDIFLSIQWKYNTKEVREEVKKTLEENLSEYITSIVCDETNNTMDLVTKGSLIARLWNGNDYQDLIFESLNKEIKTK